MKPINLTIFYVTWKIERCWPKSENVSYALTLFFSGFGFSGTFAIPFDAITGHTLKPETRNITECWENKTLLMVMVRWKNNSACTYNDWIGSV